MKTAFDAAGMPRLSRRGALLASLAAALAPGAAFAQAPWPNRPVRIVVPFSAGGAADTSARAVGQKVGEILGQSLVIENRTGGNAVVAASAVLGSPKDGYTFLWDAANQLTNPVLIKDLPFDYRSAFAPVTLAVRAPQALVVRHDFPAQNLDEFLAVARAKPGTVSCGTPPSGAMGHLALALLQQRAKVQLLHTPYRGGADAARDVMGGQIDSALITTSTARGTLATGKTRMLAVTSATRLAAYPEVPTIAERGFPGYDMDDWFGLFAAAGTPEGPIQQMQAAVVQAAKDPALAAAIAPQGTVLVANSTAEFSAFLNRQRELLQKLVRDANITIG
ncbi:twin-arginine translocation pathway signal protein [Xylophilus rhododendri]|uniref:Twin-arginine translocation pathway signal protein n=1 Tax=Xylophilus rhododendri TaxID=2697032 RepID=A0A857JCG8_9BURK|nr:tripartite tricarboxylate transporter substrate-binding protein [Xylophilus rhododendri]QHJ00800.1 twin-arginine translocation pathway signal protein [Xylophilus rhododendri]